MFIKFIIFSALALASQFAFSQGCDFNRDFTWTGEGGTCTGRGSGVSLNYTVSGTGPGGLTGSATYLCNTNTGEPTLWTASCTPPPVPCPQTTVTWSNNQCTAVVPGANYNQEKSVTYQGADYQGSANLICRAGGRWEITGNICAPTVTAPVIYGVSASDGAYAGYISISANHTSGTAFEFRYKKEGDQNWLSYSSTSSTWNFNTSDESVFVFQVRAYNSAGSSGWSAEDKGSIKKAMDPLFQSASGIPSKIGVGQSFSVTQKWLNRGAEAWSSGVYGLAPSESSELFGATFSPFTTNVASGAVGTSIINLIAPMVPGKYRFERSFVKSGYKFGSSSGASEITVLAPPTCTSAPANVASFFNSNSKFTVKLVDPVSIEAASVKVWGQSMGVAKSVIYNLTNSGGVWSAEIPIAPHFSTGETKILYEVSVQNAVFPSSKCASGSVDYIDLPVPVVSFEPKIGYFEYAGGAGKGFVANRVDGEFAKINVQFPNIANLKVKTSFVGDNNLSFVQSIPDLSSGASQSVSLLKEMVSASEPAWKRISGTLTVEYENPDAATQGKKFSQPIAVDLGPNALSISSAATSSIPLSISAQLKSVVDYSKARDGAFIVSLLGDNGQSTVRDFADVDELGSVKFDNLDYQSIYTSDLVLLARLIPPPHITLNKPIEYRSAKFTVPVIAPSRVEATDGTREDDVLISWPAVATGSAIRYIVSRDNVELTPRTGIGSLSYIDTPPERGRIYQYSVVTLINSVTSSAKATDTGFVPTCRAARFVGASLNADMSKINGMIQQLPCLTSLEGTSTYAQQPEEVVLFSSGSKYRSFSIPVHKGLSDGNHVLKLKLISAGVQINAERTYDIPFKLARGSIDIKSVSITHDGVPAKTGLESNSIGGFGITMDGGSGLGLAEEVK